MNKFEVAIVFVMFAITWYTMYLTGKADRETLRALRNERLKFLMDVADIQRDVGSCMSMKTVLINKHDQSEAKIQQIRNEFETIKKALEHSMQSFDFRIDGELEKFDEHIVRVRDNNIALNEKVSDLLNLSRTPKTKTRVLKRGEKIMKVKRHARA